MPGLSNLGHYLRTITSAYHIIIIIIIIILVILVLKVLRLAGTCHELHEYIIGVTQELGTSTGPGRWHGKDIEKGRIAIQGCRIHRQNSTGWIYTKYVVVIRMIWSKKIRILENQFTTSKHLKTETQTTRYMADPYISRLRSTGQVFRVSVALEVWRRVEN